VKDIVLESVGGITMLTIDSREKSTLCDLVMKEAKKLHIKYEQKWIEVGDYVYDDVCFEAKSVVDFIGSVMSKRLWTQLDNMDRCYQTNVVIIHGDLNEGILQIIENSKSNMPVKSRVLMLNNKFLGAMGRIILDTDIKPVWVKSEEEAAKIITGVSKIKPIKRDVIRPQVHKRLSTDDLRIDVLTSIKGVSVKKAKALIKEFGSVMEIGECSAYEMQAVEGIGETLAKRIISTLNSEEKVKI
jgi:ERCC4-type nuclease